jgi:hypothetical protein
MKKLCKLLLAVFAVFALTACGGGGDGGTPNDPPPELGEFTEASGVSTMFRGTVRKVIYANDLFMAVGGYTGYAYQDTGSRAGVAYSEDAVTWTKGSIDTAMDPMDVAYGAGKYVVVGESGWYPSDLTKNVSIVTSSDGISWTDILVPSSNICGMSFESVAFGNGTFVAVGEGSSADSFRPIMCFSADGTTWTKSDMTWLSGTLATAGSLYDVTFANGKFYAAGHIYDDVSGDNYPCILSSTDGNTWTVVLDEAGDNGDWFTSIAYGNNTFVVGTYGIGLYWSTDGLNWSKTSVGLDITSPSLFFPTPISDITFGNGQFMAVSVDGEIGTSANGSTWSKIYPNPFLTSPSAGQTVNGVAFGAGHYVVVGDDGVEDDSEGGDGLTSPKIIYSDPQ